MRRKLLAIILPAVLAAATLPAHAAAGATEDEEPFDARLAGFTNDTGGVGPIVIQPASSAAGTWILTIVLGVLCFGVMCKDGKRTHLD